ncbi:hypothetical protein BX666DRAFT_386428 [Dichotomocladium elegans]|nr:hypothetical protein BX666DRAFT_386428 [Dichotomocladium elegans]
MSNTTHLQNHQCLYNFTRISNDYGVPLCEPWDSLLKRSEALQGEGDIDGAIDAVTAVYDKLVRHQIRALELKSRFHLKKRNYYLAMHDAIDIIHMAPLMAVGYLLKVDVYLAQNQLHEALES